MGVLREMDRRSSWLSAWGRLPYMEGRKKLALMLGRPIASHRLRSSCSPAGTPSDHVPSIMESCQCSQLLSGAGARPIHFFLLLYCHSCACMSMASGCMHARQSMASQRAQPCSGSQGGALLRLGLPGMDGKTKVRLRLSRYVSLPLQLYRSTEGVIMSCMQGLASQDADNDKCLRLDDIGTRLLHACCSLSMLH